MSGIITLKPIIYPGSDQATLLKSNTQAIVWNLANPGTGVASAAVELERIKSAYYPTGISLEIAFSGAPGTFEVDGQYADTDQDSSYVTVDIITTNLNASNATRVERPDVYARFFRFFLNALTNPVSITARVTR